MLYRITDGTVSLGGREILSHIQFEVKGQEKVALCGKNGCGKTTLLKLIAGEISLDRDDRRQGKGIETAGVGLIGYLPQHVFQLPEQAERTVEEELLAACPCKDTWDRERFDYEQEYDRLFTKFGFSKEDKERKLGSFSGGQKTRIALIRLLLMKPDLLLLDEPTNHLDEEMTDWLEDWIRSYDKAVIMVSHDRYFLDNTAEIVYEIHNRTMTKYPGNYSFYMEEKERVRIRRMEEWTRQQEEVDRLNELIRKFRNKPRKASFARSRQKILERMELMEKPESASMRPFTKSITPAVLPAKYVYEAEELRIGYDKVLMEVSLRIKRGQKIGIIGPNGIGKSTFVKTAAGLLAPLNGKSTLGQRVEMEWFDQHTADFEDDGDGDEAVSVQPGSGQADDGNQTVSRHASDKKNQTILSYFKEKFPSLNERDARGILASWLFPGKDASKKLCDLSGGERARFKFCLMFQDCPNFLILDEPTNHMDIESREMLESALRAYEGTVLFVSHDRYFVNQVAQSLLVFTNEGVNYYPFGYRHYQDKLKKARELKRLAEKSGLNRMTGSQIPDGNPADGSEAAGISGAFVSAAASGMAESFANADASGIAGANGTSNAAGTFNAAGISGAIEVGAVIRAEDIALVESVRNVPKADRGRFMKISAEAMYLDWKRSLMEEDMERLGSRISEEEEKLAELEVEIQAIQLCEQERSAELDNLFEIQKLTEESFRADSEKYTEICLMWDEEFGEEDAGEGEDASCR